MDILLTLRRTMHLPNRLPAEVGMLTAIRDWAIMSNTYLTGTVSDL